MKEIRSTNQLEGLSRVLPERFKEIPFPDAQPSRVVGIAVETDNNRNHLLGKMTTAIRKGMHVIVACADVDYLKYINETNGRDYGDEAIRHSVCAMAGVVENYFPNSECYVFKDNVASDEAWAVVFARQDQLENVVAFEREVNAQPRIPFLDGDRRGISFSVGVSHTGVEPNRSFLRDTKKRLEMRGAGKPFDLLKKLRSQASSAVAEIKIKKTLVDLEGVKNGLVDADVFKCRIAEELSYMRTSEEVIISVFDKFEELIREELSNV